MNLTKKVDAIASGVLWIMNMERKKEADYYEIESRLNNLEALHKVKANLTGINMQRGYH